jgi:tetratricopeptide (TPR) repeat protein
MKIIIALEHHLAGRLSEAETLYLEILKEEPDNPDALYFSGVLARQQGRRDAAIDYIVKAVSAAPANSLYHTTLGNIFKDASDFKSAEESYRRAIACDPKHAEALLNLGNVLQQQNRIDQAIACYRQLLAAEPKHAEAHNDLGVAFMAKRSWDQAAACFNEALACKPAYAEAYNNLGVALKNQDKTDEALACYHKALEIKPDYAKALLNIGTIYYNKKDFVKAANWYQASLNIDPDQVEAHQNMALILFDAGRLAEAQHHRDMAYRRQSIFVDAAPEAKRSVLVLWAAGVGNIPIEHLVPAQTNTRITWMMEYAADDQVQMLPPYDLVLNAIGDQDAALPAAEPIARFLQDCKKPVLNHPAAIAATARDLVPELLGSIPGLVIPQTVGTATEDFKDKILTRAGIRLPLLVRPSGSHGGLHMVLIKSADALRGLELWTAETYYATNYYDYRSNDGYYRKYRMIFVDRKPYPYHLAIGSNWMIHYETAGMLEEKWKRDEELRYLEDPEKVLGPQAMTTVEAIGRRLDLDYSGLDFSLLEDGRVLVFEANATMLVHPEDKGGILGFKNPFVQRILDAFDGLMTRVTL